MSNCSNWSVNCWLRTSGSARPEIEQLKRKKSRSAAPFSETSARRILNVPDVNLVKRHSTAPFSAFKSVIGALKKVGGNVLEKLTNLIASATSQETAPANTSRNLV